MNDKSFSLFALSILTLVFVVGFASAAITLTPTTSSLSINQGKSSSFTFTITNDGGTGNQAVQNITVNSSSLVSGSNVMGSGQISVSNIPVSVNASSTSSAITVTVNVPASQVLGTYTGNITVGGVHNDTLAAVGSKNISLSVVVSQASTNPQEVIDCNSTGNPGNLDVRKIDFTNDGLQTLTTFGDDNSWYPFERITADIDVRNKGNERVNNIEIDWGLWDTKANGGAGGWVISPDNLKDFDLKDGDSQSSTVSFKIDDKMDVDLADLTDGNHYRLYAIATGEVDNTTAPQTCAYSYKEASINLERDFVILSNVDVPEATQCGSTMDVTANVWNIGSRDQNSVYLSVFSDINGSSKLLQNVPVGDLNSFDNKLTTFTFSIPGSAKEGTHHLTMNVNDENNETFQNANDDYSTYTIPFSVSGGCGVASGDNIGVSATLVSGGKAGQDLVIGTTITNSGSSTATYLITASSFAPWASSYEVNPSSLTLAPGASGQATFTLHVAKDASGENTFYIELVSGNNVKRQPVSVSIQSAGFFDSITGSAVGNNGLLWGLGILNLVLVVVIILVAVRVMRK